MRDGLDVAPLITHRFDLADAAEALAVAADRTSGQQQGHAAAGERAMTAVVTVGETMVLLDAPASGRLGPALPVGIGGAESNVAIGLARLGVDCTWVSRVGDDALGTFVAREIRAEGVRVIATRDPAAPTGLMVKEHRGGRPSRVRYYRAGSAASRLSPADVDAVADEIAAADVLHLTGITAALGASPLAAVERAIAVARAAGTVVSFDVNHRATLWSDADGGRRCSAGWRRRPTWSSPGPRRPRSCSAAPRRRPRSTRVRCWRGSWPNAARPPWWSSSGRSERWRCPATRRTGRRRCRSRWSTRSARATRSSRATSARSSPGGPVPDALRTANACGGGGLRGGRRLGGPAHPRRAGRAAAVPARSCDDPEPRTP